MSETTFQEFSDPEDAFVMQGDRSEQVLADGFAFKSCNFPQEVLVPKTVEGPKPKPGRSGVPFFSDSHS